VDELQEHIIEEWACLNQPVIDSTVKQWHQCLLSSDCKGWYRL